MLIIAFQVNKSRLPSITILVHQTNATPNHDIQNCNLPTENPVSPSVVSEVFYWSAKYASEGRQRGEPKGNRGVDVEVPWQTQSWVQVTKDYYNWQYTRIYWSFVA
jgi:hypothetical protein